MQNPYPLLKTGLLQIIEEQRDLRHWSDICIWKKQYERLLTLIKIGLESLKENQGEEDAGK